VEEDRKRTVKTSLESRSAEADADPVHIERSGGQVVVTVGGWKAVRNQRVFGSVFGFTVAVVLAVVFRSMLVQLIPLKPWCVQSSMGAILVVLGAVGLRSCDRAGRIYRYEATRDRLIVESTSWLGWRRAEFPRAAIKDLVLGFTRPSPQGSVSFAMIKVRRMGWWRRSKRFGAMEGHHAARAADALREGLGMSKRSWP
jgi:hypothetical protein